jgi:hypothetical protein
MVCKTLALCVALACAAGLDLAGADNEATPARHSSGRPLPKMPAVTRPVRFDTPEADRILEALQVFPPDNP